MNGISEEKERKKDEKNEKEVLFTFRGLLEKKVSVDDCLEIMF